MHQYYGQPQRQQFSQEDLQRLANMNQQQEAMMQMMQGSADSSAMLGAVPDGMMGPPPPQEHKELHRSRSFHQQQQQQQQQNAGHGSARPQLGGASGDMRRSPMLEFGSGDTSDLDGFQFDPSSAPSNGGNTGMQRPGNLAQRRMDGQRRRRTNSNSNNMNSQQMNNMNTGYSSMPSSYGGMQGHFPQSMSGNDPMAGFDLSGQDFLDSSMLSGMDFSAMDNMGGDQSLKDHFNQDAYGQQSMTPQMQQNIANAMSGRMHDPGGRNNVDMSGSSMINDPSMMDKSQTLPVADQLSNLQVDMPSSHTPQSMPMPNPNPGLPINHSNAALAVTNQHGLPAYVPNNKSAANMSVSSTPRNGLDFTAPGVSGQTVLPAYRNAYSSSGFDMLGVLMRVATRPKPQINIGAVDMSCAFVVCDVTQHDMPICYCSDVFERLTAYTRHEILGRNCRFLQAPDGKIEAGVHRKYVDDQSVYRIKKMITARQEAQISVINYRKGGQPFMNLLTMIPITWDSDEIKYYVGFQVDLVEQPTSITNRNPDGSYTINYQRGLLPRYVVPETPNKGNTDLGQTVPRDDVSAVLSTIGSGDTELSKRIWDKVLLENSDDVVHVLSLKGLFLYLSPSSKKVLEYEPSELVGTALSSVCHPSDIVPVTRELKDTSAGAAVNVVFRIRRKYNGYTWFESHGSLHLEQGKGRKCIVMVGRERPVYALARNEITADGGFGESELWTKMSTSGMFLFVSSNVRSLLDRQPKELIGTSAQTLMRQDSRIEFGKKLELARTGIKTSFKHDVRHKRGQTLQARTTLYPGDATEGQKPTFLVAQTRLLRLSRSAVTRQPSAASGGSGSLDQHNKPVSPGSSLSGGAAGTSGAPGSGTVGSNGGGAISGTLSSAASTQPFQASGIMTHSGGAGLMIGSQHEALASEDNVFDELKTTRSTSWQFELRQMEKRNRLLAEELQTLLSNKKKRKRRNGVGNMLRECVNCHTTTTPEWRKGADGQRNLCNSCGLRWAKENGRVNPRSSSNKSASSPIRSNSQESSGNAANLNIQQQNALSSLQAATAANAAKLSLNDDPFPNPVTEPAGGIPGLGNTSAVDDTTGLPPGNPNPSSIVATASSASSSSPSPPHVSQQQSDQSSSSQQPSSQQQPGQGQQRRGQHPYQAPSHNSEERFAATQERNDSHTRKTGRMQAKPAEGYAGGIPPKIEEGVES